MTDLERAQDAWRCPKCGLYGTESIHDSHVCVDDEPHNAPSLKALLAAARREGAEAERAANAEAKDAIVHIAMAQGAAEMRERAAARLHAQLDDEMGDFAAEIVRALPLTPEEPE